MEDLRIWCVGNPLLGDDAVGCRVAELLAERGVPGAVDCGTTPENHLATLRRNPPRTLLIVDAADMGLTGGEVRRLSLEVFEAFGVSNHGIPLSLLLQPFGGTIDIVVLGVQPVSLQLGAPLSPDVQKAGSAIAEAIAGGEWQKFKNA